MQVFSNTIQETNQLTENPILYFAAQFIFLQFMWSHGFDKTIFPPMFLHTLAFKTVLTVDSISAFRIVLPLLNYSASKGY